MSIHKPTSRAHPSHENRRAVNPLGLLLVVLVLAACSKPPPETELVEAGQALGEATTELADLETRIKETESSLQALRADRRKQRDRVRTLEQRLEARATDVAVFRAVQTALLDDVSLQDAAIAVDVEEGVVTLSGVVRTQEQARRAVAIGEQTAGVARVSSQIRINDPAAAPSGSR